MYTSKHFDFFWKKGGCVHNGAAHCRELLTTRANSLCQSKVYELDVSIAFFASKQEVVGCNVGTTITIHKRIAHQEKGKGLAF
jgi:hypothetical protein